MARLRASLSKALGINEGNKQIFKPVHTAKATIAEGAACNLLACHVQRNEACHSKVCASWIISG